MSDWIGTAERLRTVKRAREDFLVREVIDQLVIGPLLLDRIAEDLGGLHGLYRRCGETLVQESPPAVDE